MIYKKLYEYKIIKTQYFNEYGKSKGGFYYIKYRVKFLGIKYWRILSHEEGNYRGSYNAVTQFDTQTEAEDFIRDVLCKNIPTDKNTMTTVRHITCND